jgi:ABC-type phosphate/phosphonate transport system substrate-binding protein
MPKIVIPWGMLALIVLITACAPEVLTVEVTRAVLSEGENVAATMPPTAPPPPPIEVTRLVTVEATRLVTETITVTVTPRLLGSSERPYQLLFAPQFPEVILLERAQPLAAALSQALGAEVAAGVLNDETAVQTVLCAAPQDTIALLSPLAAAEANLQCGSQVLATGVQANGLPWQAGMVVVRRGFGLFAPADLNGLVWGVAGENSLINHLYWAAFFAENDIVPAEIRFYPGDNAALLALYNGEIDFATATYLPPILPFDEEKWTYGEDDPEVWRRLGIPPTRSGQGFVVVNGVPEFGGYQVRDARAGIFDTTPEIFNTTEILEMTPPLPVETVVVGADFPLAAARRLQNGLLAFGVSEGCASSLCAGDYLNWRGLSLLADEELEPLRLVVRQEMAVEANE